MDNLHINSTGSFEPKMVAFVCNWCTYAGADLTGTSRIKYQPNVRVIRLPCTGRIDYMLVLKAFATGADGVIVSGCHPGDCHYGTGNLYARRKLAITKKLLEFAGMEPGRFRVEWISASEGNIYAEVVESFTNDLKALGPQTRFRIGKEGGGGQ